ncbi:MAG: PAS domain S-box protein [Deltaproteobacteria bacterium]|nr:MAG: PAS domain S-box protein [Deltaproteobacteria bacterium]
MTEAARTLPSPSSGELLDAVLRLGRDVHLEMTQGQIVDRFLDVLEELFPGRALCVRVVDVRRSDPAAVTVRNGVAREGLQRDPISVRPSAIEKSRVKTAVAESAHLRVSPRWDSPFQGLAAGFTVPLVASGELYGALDVGYPLGVDLAADDEPLVVPIANHLAVALRTERLHRETNLLRDYQAKLIEHANALILGVDRRWRINVCNQALCELIGAERADILGTDLRDWLPRSARGALTKSIADALRGEPIGALDVELETRSGQRVRTLWSVAAISRAGHVEAVVAVGQDQTRVRELQRQVIQAEKLATLGQLAAGVVHELNNPLTSITVYADYLLKKAESARGGAPTSLDEGDVEKLRRIRAGAQRILDFAQDLVHYAKPTGSEVKRVSLYTVVEQSLSFCEHLFGKADVRLIKDVSPDAGVVLAVPGQIEQVIINLVTNAVHAAPRGGTVWVRTIREGDDWVGVQIDDDGPGIEEQHRDKIFEPFFTTKYDGAGTGLGLSIVKNILDHHGGTISVGRSEAGGASFRVLLRRLGGK